MIRKLNRGVIQECYRLSHEAYIRKDGEIVDIEYVTHQKGDVFYIALRGTGKDKGKWGWIGLAKDLLRDFRVFPWQSRRLGGIRPAGPLKAAQAFWKVLGSDIPKGTKIVVSGHSLGAWVGTIFQEILLAEGHNVIGVFFACPLTGESNYLNEYNYLSFKNGGDPICSIPSLFGAATRYEKIGKFRWLIWRDHYLLNYADPLERWLNINFPRSKGLR